MNESTDHGITGSSIEIDNQCYARAVVLPGGLPALAIGYGGTDTVLSAGPRLQDAAIAKEFAITLASAALAFAGGCTVRLTQRRDQHEPAQPRLNEHDSPNH
ncbi:hypothetical protein [Amycolatopsis cihanbeyliensis]|uniref:Uncharacterized protein n=1 Tax=Amycolatopsis cihanbeyliensis TaxID=1128664 RepID=A0A542DEW9_AMYCI|nr:hypothetical protein [Amycolatopsis cihanbeyliensis]TQJ01590.1 hypothetical protein FB471_1283 [Amycolatopsis cihanbeyliensis]